MAQRYLTLCAGGRCWTAPAWAKGRIAVCTFSLCHAQCHEAPAVRWPPTPPPGATESHLCVPSWLRGRCGGEQSSRGLPTGPCRCHQPSLTRVVKVPTGPATCSPVPPPCNPSRQSGLSGHPQEVAVRPLRVHTCVRRPVKKAQSSFLGPAGGIAPPTGPLSSLPTGLVPSGALWPPPMMVEWHLRSSKLASLSVGWGAPPCPPKHTLSHPRGPTRDPAPPCPRAPPLGPRALCFILLASTRVTACYDRKELTFFILLL